MHVNLCNRVAHLANGAVLVDAFDSATELADIDQFGGASLDDAGGLTLFFLDFFDSRRLLFGIFFFLVAGDKHQRCDSDCQEGFNCLVHFFPRLSY